MVEIEFTARCRDASSPERTPVSLLNFGSMGLLESYSKHETWCEFYGLKLEVDLCKSVSI